MSQPAPIDHPAFSFVQTVGGIEEYRHAHNGLTVLLLSDEGDSTRGAAAPVATFMLTYRVGSRNEGAGLTGATHLLEHLMFKGTDAFNRDNGTSVFQVLQRVGAQINATTWYDRTNYYALLPREHLGLAIEIEADRMRGARISDEDLASERTVVLNELDRGENEPLRKLFHAVFATAFFAHPYGHPVIGWRSDVETVTPEGLSHFYDTYYWPRYATASVVGPVDQREALDLLDAHFGSIPEGPEAAREAPEPLTHRDAVTQEPPQRGERRVVVRQTGQLGSVLLAWKAPPGLDPDADRLDVLAQVLAGGKSARLFRRLTDSGLATHASAFFPRLRDPGLFVVHASLTPGTTHAQVEDELRAVMTEIATDGISDAELERARRQVVADAAFGRDGPYAVAERLNEAIALGDWTLYPDYSARIEAVTAPDVQAAAARLVNNDRLTVGHYIPEASE